MTTGTEWWEKGMFEHLESSSTPHTEQGTKRVGTRPGCEVRPPGIKRSTHAAWTVLEKSLLPTDAFQFPPDVTRSPRTAPWASSCVSPVPHCTWPHCPPHRSCSHGRAPAAGLHARRPFHLESSSLRCLHDVLLRFLRVPACVLLLPDPDKRAATPFPPRSPPYSPYHHMSQHMSVYCFLPLEWKVHEGRGCLYYSKNSNIVTYRIMRI